MARPAAIVQVTFRCFRNVDASVFAGAVAPFALGRVGVRRLGRLPVTLSSGQVNLHESSAPFEHTVAVAPGAEIPLAIDLWDQDGDTAARRLLRFRGGILPPWAAGQRVIAVGPIELVVDVATTLVPGPARIVAAPRSGPDQTTRTPVAVPPTAVVEITATRGIHQLGAASPDGRQRQAGPVATYAGEDDLGRVYLDHELDGSFAMDTQKIELAVTVTMIGAALPSGLKIRWTVLDPDDLSNDARLETSAPGTAPNFDDPPNVHREAGELLDPDDYNAPRGPRGRGDDNSGAVRVSPRFVEVAPHTITVNSATEADTVIVNRESRVVIHCPSHAGDNLIVRAEVTPTTGLISVPAETGILTMWHRIDLQYLQMTGAHPIPLDQVVGHFRPAFVEMNPENGAQNLVSPGPNDHIAGDEPTFRTVLPTFMDSHFPHARQGGWFCLLAARKPYPEVAQRRIYPDPASPDPTGPATAGAGRPPASIRSYAPLKDYIEIPRTREAVGSILVQVDATRRLVFNAAGQQRSPTDRTKTRVWIVPHDIVGEFTAGDGSEVHATSTSRYHYLTDPVASGGYNITGPIQVKVGTLGHYPAGTSPFIRGSDGRRYFAGRTAIFTDLYANGAETVSSVVHELTHAFGLPHKCGYYDFLLPREHSCCMNYGIHGLLAPQTQAIQVTPIDGRIRGSDLCGRHIREIRNTEFRLNLGLGW